MECKQSCHCVLIMALLSHKLCLGGHIQKKLSNLKSSHQMLCYIEMFVEFPSTCVDSSNRGLTILLRSWYKYSVQQMNFVETNMETFNFFMGKGEEFFFRYSILNFKWMWWKYEGCQLTNFHSTTTVTITIYLVWSWTTEEQEKSASIVTIPRLPMIRLKLPC